HDGWFSWVGWSAGRAAGAGRHGSPPGTAGPGRRGDRDPLRAGGSVPALELHGLVVLAVVVEGLLEGGRERVEHLLRIGAVAVDLRLRGADLGDGALIPVGVVRGAGVLELGERDAVVRVLRDEVLDGLGVGRGLHDRDVAGAG